MNAALCSSVRLWSLQQSKVRIQPAMRPPHHHPPSHPQLLHSVCIPLPLPNVFFLFTVTYIKHREHTAAVCYPFSSLLFSSSSPFPLFIFRLLCSCHDLNQLRSSPSQAAVFSFTWCVSSNFNEILFNFFLTQRFGSIGVDYHMIKSSFEADSIK